jgi:hypothetical protein
MNQFHSTERASVSPLETSVVGLAGSPSALIARKPESKGFEAKKSSKRTVQDVDHAQISSAKQRRDMLADLRRARMDGCSAVALDDQRMDAIVA